MAADAHRRAQKIDQRVATLNPTYGWAGMSSGAATIHFARCNPC